jgi:hypothetical protein
MAFSGPGGISLPTKSSLSPSMALYARLVSVHSEFLEEHMHWQSWKRTVEVLQSISDDEKRHESGRKLVSRANRESVEKIKRITYRMSIFRTSFFSSSALRLSVVATTFSALMSQDGLPGS